MNSITIQRRAEPRKSNVQLSRTKCSQKQTPPLPRCCGFSVKTFSGLDRDCVIVGGRKKDDDIARGITKNAAPKGEWEIINNEKTKTFPVSYLKIYKLRDRRRKPVSRLFSNVIYSVFDTTYY